MDAALLGAATPAAAQFGAQSGHAQLCAHLAARMPEPPWTATAST
ncbi:hypothetical protein ACPC54_08825 [Kitasatospora sp. NPDC094028]